MINFKYSTPTKVYFGKGEISKISDEIKKYGSKILLAYGGGSIKKNGIYNEVIKILKNNSFDYVELSNIEPNPQIETVKRGIEICRKNNVNFILAVGGGSVIDCAKAVSIGVFYNGDPWDFFMGKVVAKNALPIGAVLTISATGSEANANSVISNEKTNQKLPYKTELFIPKFAVLDPVYTFSVNKYQTAAGTSDIMSHCFEQYFSAVEDTFVQDRLTEAIIKTCIEFGDTVLQEPDNYNARANIMWASNLALNGLLSFGKKGDWATHFIEHIVSAYFELTHGAGLAIITPHWMRYILDENTVDKFVALGKNVWEIQGNDKFKIANKCIDKITEFFKSQGFPEHLSEVGIDLDNNLIEKIAEGVVIFGATGNIKLLKKEDVINILNAAK